MTLISVNAAGSQAWSTISMDLSTFVLSAAALLATPGPTNTLLATAGAGRGARASLSLLLAELSGYLLAIATLRLVLGPVLAAAPLFGQALRFAVVLYLLQLAVALWRNGSDHAGEVAPVTFQRVLVTTLLNPKAIIFAFTLLPPAELAADLRPFVLALACSTIVIGGGWIVLGATLRRGLAAHVPARIGYRCSAAALAMLACVILAPALAGP
ncbi:LysE family translocator [Bradyrhizobium sp. HKCCYLS2038]|uniref:LysE family translocator n=1 Tax=unclassified Bradyrhizobium TaxID=2631580 RepID=UPI003EBA3C4B